jgi:hypothetical protein
MNSYNLAINGSWILFIALALVIIGFSYYSYKNTNPPISGIKRYTMLTLRIVGMLLLLFAIFQPIVTNRFDEIIKPRIALLIDGSESMTITDAKLDRSEITKKLVEELQSELEEDDYYFVLKDQLETNKQDSITELEYDSKRTNLAKPLRELSYRQDTTNTQAVILLTDGSYNSGENPFYAAAELGRPIFTVGVGDTTEPRDVKLADLIANEVSYVNTPTPVFINVDQFGFKDEEVSVKVTANGDSVGTETIKLFENQKRYKLKYSFTPDEPGNYKIVASVSTLEGEVTTKNNSKTNIIKVLENKKSIAIFGGRPSYDVSFFVKELNKNSDQEIHKFVQKSSTEFYETFSQKELRDAQIIAMIGFPNKSTDSKYMELIKKELKRGKPLIFITSSDIDYRKLKIIEDYLPFKILSESSNELQVLAKVDVNSANNSILRVEGESNASNWNELPPIFTTETFIKPNPESTVIMRFGLDGTNMNEPLIVSRSLSGKKSLFFMGYGLQSWKLKGYARELAKGNEAVDLYAQLIENSLRWLSIDSKFESFLVRTNKKQYTEGEEVEFFAQLYDDSYLALEEAVIKVKIEAEEYKTEIVLSEIGNGQYNYKLENLSKGDYNYSAIAKVDGKIVGTSGGRFIIGELNSEYDDLTMNKSLLHSIADETGGNFYHNSVDNLIDDIKAKENYREKYISQTKDYPLWDLPLFLILSLLCFATEWLMRKLSGLI